MVWFGRLIVVVSPRGRKLQMIFVTTSKIIALWERLGLFRRYRQRILYWALKMEWFGRLNVVISPLGWKLQWIFVEIGQLIASSVRLGLFRRKRQLSLCCAHNGVIWAFKRRNISNGMENTDDYGQNWTNDRVLRATGIVLTLKAECTMLCA
jgi:hypothetical protein